jgi:predicted phage terminase large subunit-like protein
MPELIVARKTEDDHLVQDQFDPKKNFVLIMMPRGTFKTSVVTVGFTLQNLLIDPNIRILLDSETYAKSKAFLSEIKGHLENNERYREIFKFIHGCYPDDGKRNLIWSDSQIVTHARSVTRKEPTVSCSGIDKSINGMHYDLIIADDLHSEQNVTTKDQIDKVKDHYRFALSLLDPGKPMIIIGTRWDYNDLYQHILDYEGKRFNVLLRKAILDDGSLLFPERLTAEFLTATRETQGSYIFSCQYLNSPVDDETATFKRSTFHKVPWSEVEKRPINWNLIVDPSYAGQYSDYAAFVLGGMDFQREIFVRHILRAKMTYGDIINNIFDLYTRFRPNRIFVEVIGTKTLEHELNNEQKRRGAWLPITFIRSRAAAKEDRVRSLAPFYEFGHIYHIKECPQLDDLEYELLHFPKGTHDDIIDALATIPEVTTAPSNRRAASDPDDDRVKRRILYKPRSPITGV